MLAFKIAVVADLHYSSGCPLPVRRGEYAHIFLARVVHRLNHIIKPDVLLVMGDCLDVPQAADAKERLETLKSILDKAECPVIAVPGNHDPEPDVFYEVMERPAPVVDIGPVRFLTFLDPEEPGYNAVRLPQDLQRMRKAREGHSGPVVFLQHVPVFPSGLTKCPYGYTNIDEIIEIMDEYAITLSIGGHYHRGTELVHHNRSSYLAVKALCEDPFEFCVITIDDDGISAMNHSLKMPAHLGLIDRHVHSEYAYCGEDMDMEVSVELAELFGLAGLVFTEHSSHLYYGRDPAWRQGFSPTYPGMPGRMPQYWQSAKPFLSDSVQVGLEVDYDFHGRPVLLEEDRKRSQLLVGAVHFLPASMRRPVDVERLADEYMATLAKLMPDGMHVLAHPFRIFRRSGVETPDRLYEPMVRLLKEHKVAAELNFHTNSPDPEFFRMCIDAGVKISFGSDAHAQYEVGEFAQHLQLLSDCGFDGDLKEILL
ncbi:MAG: hypothetical protein GX162_05735 [Firmicutes bacterium]|nr:hypothetical protein [Bacillota bacterium]